MTVKDRINGNRIFVTAGFENTGIAGRIGNINQEIFPKNKITIDMFGNVFFRHYEFSADDNILVLFDNMNLSEKCLRFISVLISNQLNLKYNYGKQFRLGSYNTTKIKLPIIGGKIAIDFMETFITDLESERISILDTYLKTTGLNDVTLTEEETKALKEYENLAFSKFNLEDLFGKSTRGKRLKSLDRIEGNLPFVTAGEADEGVSAFIGNEVTIFNENTVTIDMFGSAKYRNYKYGGDDHIAVVDTSNLDKFSAIFVTSAIHKSTYNGQYNYGRNFYAKDADSTNIILPSINGKPDYNSMNLIISAIHKLVIKDVVNYVDKKL